MSKPAYRAFAVTVAAVDRMSPSFLRVTFRSDDLADIGWDGPDQRIKVVLPLPVRGFGCFPSGDDWYAAWRALPDNERNPIRTYTIRRADGSQRELVVDFVVHGDTGPASRWANRAEVGSELAVIAPDATSAEPAGGYEWRAGRATQLLLAGDETAVPAVSAILESLPNAASGAAFLEVPCAADLLDLHAPPGVEVHWLPRAGRPSVVHGHLLNTAVREWVGRHRAQSADLVGGLSAGRDDDVEADPDDVVWEAPAAPDGDGLYAWLAGEAGAITGLRRHFVRDLGIDRSRVAAMGYWRLGRPES